jgi:hypothetical protein
MHISVCGNAQWVFIRVYVWVIKKPAYDVNTIVYKPVMHVIGYMNRSIVMYEDTQLG